HAKRWEDVEQLRDAGIDVITTVNVQHIASLSDVIEQITGTVQRETVPDAVVRGADQIEVVDLAPQSLRDRLSAGLVYPAERVDAALSNYFRLGNLTALREL
ncbi:histidine kinase, partial [Ralstonia pickettii]